MRADVHGIPQDDTALGARSVPATLIEFAGCGWSCGCSRSCGGSEPPRELTPEGFSAALDAALTSH